MPRPAADGTRIRVHDVQGFGRQCRRIRKAPHARLACRRSTSPLGKCRCGRRLDDLVSEWTNAGPGQLRVALLHPLLFRRTLPSSRRISRRRIRVPAFERSSQSARYFCALPAARRNELPRRRHDNQLTPIARESSMGRKRQRDSDGCPADQERRVTKDSQSVLAGVTN